MVGEQYTRGGSRLRAVTPAAARGALMPHAGGLMVDTFTDPASGGTVRTEAARIIEAGKNKQELEKYQKEEAMCKTLARAGHAVEHFAKPKDGTYDIKLDGVPAELKRTGANNIRRHAKHATERQGAKLVVFQFGTWDRRTAHELEKLAGKGIHGYYFITGHETVTRF